MLSPDVVKRLAGMGKGEPSGCAVRGKESTAGWCDYAKLLLPSQSSLFSYKSTSSSAFFPLIQQRLANFYLLTNNTSFLSIYSCDICCGMSSNQISSGSHLHRNSYKQLFSHRPFRHDKEDPQNENSLVLKTIPCQIT